LSVILSGDRMLGARRTVGAVSRLVRYRRPPDGGQPSRVGSGRHRAVRQAAATAGTPAGGSGGAYRLLNAGAVTPGSSHLSGIRGRCTGDVLADCPRCDNRPVARVDPADDSVRRYIVQHYRYDPDRRQRRNVVVAAFDSRREFEACFRATSEHLEGRRAAGDDVDPREHVSGTVREPGGDKRAADGRLLMRAARRGVPLGPWADELELPSNIGIFRSESSSRAKADPARLASLISRWRRRPSRS